MPKWTEAAIPDQAGRIVIVTGASSGIGEEAARGLAAKGAKVILAVRSQSRGDAARARILARVPGADMTVSIADMADLGSVRAFAARMDAELPRVDILINNAGLGMQPTRAVTVDGYERQFATNHLGPFALTGVLMPALLRAPAARVVAIASLAHRRGRIDFDDLQGARAYDGGRAYGQSKLANLMFAFELDRRARAARSRLMSVAAHPGVATTGFMAATEMPGFKVALATFAIGLLGQDAAHGAWPGLYAATMPSVHGGEYWGPDTLMEVRGAPAPATIGAHAKNREDWARLWAASERLTGVVYPDLGPPL